MERDERPRAPRKGELPSLGWVLYRLRRDSGWDRKDTGSQYQTPAAQQDAQNISNVSGVSLGDPQTLADALNDPRYAATDDNIREAKEPGEVHFID